MRVTKLAIRNFKNLRSIDLEPAPGLNVIVGRNGQGKTNFLEALHFAVLGRSYRTLRDADCLPWGDGERGDLYPDLRASLHNDTQSWRSKTVFTAEGRRAFVDDQLVSRLAELWGRVAIVTFTPHDVGLFQGPPGGRRRFIDQSFSGASERYLQQLQRYQRALRQLNALLRSSGGNPSVGERIRDQAEPFYESLAESGASLIAMRAEYFVRLNDLCVGVYPELGGGGEFTVEYRPSVGGSGVGEAAGSAAVEADLVQTLRERLGAQHARHIVSGHLSSGPHRDDMAALLEGRDLGQFGSQGQQRLAALAVKLSMGALLEGISGRSPILLLDDFGSELDRDRREAVLTQLRRRAQVFVTSTDLDHLGPPDRFDLVRTMEEGQWA